MSDREANRMDALDAQLESALASYTPAETPAGLERRLVARLVAADLAPRRRPAMWGLGWAWGACAALAVLLAVVGLHIHWRSPEANGKPAAAARPRPADAARGAVAVAASAGKASPRALRTARRTTPAHTLEEARLGEMRAASRPAPQAPLTAEERMLLRVVERRDPEQMAMLNPLVRANREAESDREFQNFVEQSSTGNE